MDILYFVLFPLFVLVCSYIYVARNEALKQKIFAKLWLSGMSKQTDIMLYRCKKELMKKVKLEGNLLEVGSGDGINMKYYLQYSDNIKSLTCIEPNKQFTDVLNSKSTSFPINNYNLRFSEFVASSEKKVDKFDVIILCLVLCSIEDPSEVIDECYKLLVPGGRLLVLEHVIDQESTQAMLMQYLFNPLWKIFGDNCCLTRQPFLHLRTMDWTDISEQMIRVNKNKIPVLRQFYSCVATK